MIYLQPNTAGNVIYLTLKERDKELGAVTDYLVVLTHSITLEKYYLIASVNETNERYTKITLGTDTDSPTSGSILLTETGQYLYDVYGQNSDTNLDPTDDVVEGLFELGTCTVRDSLATYYDVPVINDQTDVIYYAG